MLAAGQSTQMAQKDQQDVVSVSQHIAQRHKLTVYTLKRKIRGNVASK